MQLQTIPLAEISPADLGRWRELAARAIEPNPFHEPEYVLPLARGLGQLGDVQVMVVRDSEGWQACLPVDRRRWHRVPLSSVASWRGHYLYGLLGTPLASADRTHDALAELIRGLLATPGVGFAALEEVADDGPVRAALDEVLKREAALLIERFERPAVRRRPGPTYLEAAMSGKRRKQLRRLRRRLAEQLGEDPVCVDRADEESAYSEFIALEAAEEKARQRSVLGENPAHAGFFMTMCDSFAELGRLQMLCLEGGGHTIAMQCNLLAGDVLFGVKVAYDQRWASFSPGAQLEVEGIRVFHENMALNLMDSCAGPTNPLLNRLWPDRRSVATYALPANGPRGWVAAPALRLTRSLRELNRARRARRQ